MKLALRPDSAFENELNIFVGCDWWGKTFARPD